MSKEEKYMIIIYDYNHIYNIYIIYIYIYYIYDYNLYITYDYSI